MAIEIGKRYRFETISEQHRGRNNEICEVIRPLTKKEADIDIVGNMYIIRFVKDGVEIDAWEDELKPLEGGE